MRIYGQQRKPRAQNKRQKCEKYGRRNCSWGAGVLHWRLEAVAVGFGFQSVVERPSLRGFPPFSPTFESVSRLIRKRLKQDACYQRHHGLKQKL